MNLLEKLKELGACEDAMTWVGDKTIEESWLTCTNPSWMFWFACRVGAQRESVLAAADIAEKCVVKYWKSDDRPMKAIEAARICANDPTPENRAAAWAARAAARAADAAAWAAWAAAAWAAAAAADAAAWAAADADAAGAANSESADTIRKHLPIERLRNLSGVE